MSSTSGTSFSPFENNGASSSNSSKAATDPSNQLQLFADERRSAISIPKIETDVGSNISSHSSSPYTSPRLAPRRKSAAGIGAMEEVTLPPIQAAVPMRRGAVSGASSGPLMPFPPIRPPYQDDEIPSRGPSPTLGKRGSFSMGHSNHVPPGPDIQLPTPVLSGSGERRGGLMSIPNYINTASSSSPSSSSLAHHPADLSDSLRSNGYTRPSEEGPYQYHPVPQRHGVPWSHHKSTIPRSESVEAVPPPLPTYQSSSPPMMHSSSSTGGSNHLRPAQFNDDRHYQSHARLPHLTPSHSRQYDPQHHASSGGYRYDYHRDESAMSPSSSNHGILHQDSSLSPRTKQEHYLHEENQHIHDLDSALNGKRPRSAPRVMSSQPRIFACTQCPARFARNHDLKRHQRGHLSVRPYPCNWCEKSFSRKDALKRHILVKVRSSMSKARKERESLTDCLGFSLIYRDVEKRAKMVVVEEEEEAAREMESRNDTAERRVIKEQVIMQRAAAEIKMMDNMVMTMNMIVKKIKMAPIAK